MAGTAVGYFSSLESAAKEIRNQTLYSVEPEEEQLTIYDELYQVYKELYPSLKQFFALCAGKS
jgi:xylulokinase